MSAQYIYIGIQQKELIADTILNTVATEDL